MATNAIKLAHILATNDIAFAAPDAAASIKFTCDLFYSKTNHHHLFESGKTAHRMNEVNRKGITRNRKIKHRNTNTSISDTNYGQLLNYSVKTSKPQLSKYTLTIMHYSVKTWMMFPILTILI